MKIQFIQNLIYVSTQNQPFCLFDVMQGKQLFGMNHVCNGVMTVDKLELEGIYSHNLVLLNRQTKASAFEMKQ